MKATLTFDLPREGEKYITCVRAQDYCSAIYDLASEVRRMQKYNDEPVDATLFYEKIWEVLGAYKLDPFEEPTL